MNELERRLSQLPPVTFEPKTGFSENWQAALGLAMTEDLPITSRLIPSVAEQRREKILYDHYRNGNIPDNVWNYFDGDAGVDMEELAEYANRYLGLDDVPTREEFETARQQEYANYRQHSQRVFDQQDGWGMVGQFAGNMHATVMDPLYAASFFTGYGMASTTLKAIAAVGAVEAGIEVAAQPFIKSWKDEIGAKYGAADMVANVLLAGVTTLKALTLLRHLRVDVQEEEEEFHLSFY